MSEVKRPKVPKNPIVADFHPDTLNRVAGILDFIASADEEAQLNGGGMTGYFWIRNLGLARDPLRLCRLSHTMH